LCLRKCRGIPARGDGRERESENDMDQFFHGKGELLQVCQKGFEENPYYREDFPSTKLDMELQCL
jgi:hypothetical protein